MDTTTILWSLDKTTDACHQLDKLMIMLEKYADEIDDAAIISLIAGITNQIWKIRLATDDLYRKVKGEDNARQD